MADFTLRQINLLQILDKAEHPVSGKQLSEQLSVSLRTIQNEVRTVNQGALGRIILSGNAGYSLDRTSGRDLSVLREPLSSTETDTDLTALLKLLILDHTSIHFDTLADQLYVSSSTLTRRLGKLESLLEHYQLTLTRKKNLLSIQGNENSKRQLIYDMIVRETNANFHSPEKLKKYFANLNFVRIQEIVIAAVSSHNYYLEPCHTFNLIINLMVTLSRIRNQFPMEYPESSMPADSTEYLIAQDICQKLGEHWCISFQGADIAFIAMLITGQIKASFQREALEDREHLLFFIQKIILETFSYYALEFQNETFLANFVHHILALIQRARNRQYVTNLVSENVRELNPFIYDVSVHLAHILEKEFLISVIPEEINLLSIYIGLMLHPSFGKDQVRTLLICDEYHHIAEYLTKRLSHDFSSKLQIVDVLTHIPDNLSAQNVDLILHTIPLHILGARTLLISPFYQKSDFLAVENMLNELLLKRQHLRRRSLLLTYFDPALFFRNQGLRTKDEAIRFLGNHLEHMGICQKGFTESVFRRESLSSTCFFESFAIPHAIELNAKLTQFCVLIEEEGILWDDVKIPCVFMIAVRQADNPAFSEIYSSTIDFLCDKTALSQLTAAENFPAFIHCFEHPQ